MESVSPRRPWLVAAAVLFGVALQLPSIGAGFFADDYVHQLVLRGMVRTERMTPAALYDFGGREEWLALPGATGSLPWWTGSDWEIRFFRPLSSASLRVDHALFGGWAPGYHATSLLLYALLLVLVHRLYRSLGFDAGAAVGALALFAATNGAALPAGWLSNRNSLLATLFTLAAVLAVARPERARRAGWIAAAFALSIAACLSKESGVLAFALVALRLALAARGAKDARARRPPWIGAAVAVALAGAFLVFLAAAGYGTHSLFYATPWREPLRYLEHLSVLFTAGLFRLVAPASLDLLQVEPRLTLPVVALSALLVALLVRTLLPRLRRAPQAAFLAAWLVLALLPQGSTVPSDRLLLDAAVASAGLLALFVTSVVGKRAAADASLRERFAARTLVVSAGALSAAFALVQAAAVAAMSRDVRAIDLATEVGPPELGTREVFVLQADRALVPFSLAATWAIESTDADLRFWILQMGRRAVEWTREDERSFVLRSLDEPFLTHVFERVYRTDPKPPAAGERFPLAFFEVEALESDASGLRAIRVRLDRSLDDPTLRFVADRDGALAHVRPPAIGATRTLPRAEPEDAAQL